MRKGGGGGLLELWLRERDAAVMSMDVEKFKAFVVKWQQMGAYPKRPFPSDFVCEITMRKMACNITTMPPDVVKQAREWLQARGYDTKIY